VQQWLRAAVVISTVLALAGCDLFGELEEESSLSQDIDDACDHYCQAWVRATEDCYVFDGCEITNVGSLIDECYEECTEIANDLDEDTAWEAVDCMWCIVDLVGTEPDCLDYSEDNLAVCADDCDNLEQFHLSFEWHEHMDMECWDEY
jgi:hypothetical protein